MARGKGKTALDKGAKDNRMYDPRNKDSYQARGKYPQPCVCGGCGAVFQKGGWRWGAARPDLHRHLCPACQRVHDRVPAGFVEVRGDFFAGHRQEILALIHHTEAKEKAEHPLQRIMNIAIDEQGATISLTDVHLTHKLGEALQHAYKGKLKSRYTDKDTVMRVTWTR